MNTENTIKKLSQEIFEVVKEKVDEEASARASADSAINSDISDMNQDIQGLQSDVSDINDLIPEDASSSNKLATEDYVDNNGGKIDSISINGTPQTIDVNKNVDLPAYPEEVIFVEIDRGATSIDQETLEQLMNFDTGMKPVYITLTTQQETDSYPVLTPIEFLNNTWGSAIDINGGYWTLTVDVHELGAGVDIQYHQSIATKTDLDSKVDKADIGYFVINNTSGVLTDTQYAEAMKKYCYIKYNEISDDPTYRPTRVGCLLYKVNEDSLSYIFEYCDARKSEYFGPNVEVNNVRLVLWKSDKHYTTTNSNVGVYSNISINNMLDEVNNTIQNESDRATTNEVVLDQKIEEVNTRAITKVTGNEIENGNYVAGTTYYCTESSESFTIGNMYFATGTNTIVKVNNTPVSMNPAITSFNLYDENYNKAEVELGDKLDILKCNVILKKPNSFTSDIIITDGVYSTTETPASSIAISLTSSEYTNNTWTVSGQVGSTTLTKTASILEYKRMFFRGSNDVVTNILTSLKDVQTTTPTIQTNTTNNALPNKVILSLGSTNQYVYFIVPSEINISYISSGGFEVPYSLIDTTSFTNHYDNMYNVKVYRTDAQIFGNINFDMQYN